MKPQTLQFYKQELPRLKEERKKLIEERRCAKYELTQIEIKLRNVIRKIKIRQQYE